MGERVSIAIFSCRLIYNRGAVAKKFSGTVMASVCVCVPSRIVPPRDWGRERLEFDG